MKEIITNSFKRITADLIDFPPIDGEEESSEIKKKKKKKIYQLNLIVDDFGIEDDG